VRLCIAFRHVPSDQERMGNDLSRNQYSSSVAR
jgi:hypothetical protein